jgi:O-succinylbenzoate synthase
VDGVLPFLEYDDAEAATWLSAALDFGWRPQPTPVRAAVPVNATVPAVAAADVPTVLARFDGCRTAKVKVAEIGQTSRTTSRVRTVRATMGPEGRIRIDANAGWNVDEAEHAVHALAGSTSNTSSSRARASTSSPSCASASPTGTSRSPRTRACARHPTLAVARAGAADLSS